MGTTPYGTADLPAVRTPWGDSDELRGRKLPPGPGTPRAEVERNQRERLYGAMVAVAMTKGYAKTTVADLIGLSGVSRSAFYRHFDDKLDCFLATEGEILNAAVAVTANRLRREGSWEERARWALESFAELFAGQPAGARLCLIESHAAGPEAVARMDEALGGFEGLMRQALEERPEQRGMPEEVIAAMVGGIRKITHTRLHRGTEGELIGLIPDLLEVGLSYRPPPTPLRVPRLEAVSPASNNHRPSDPAERIVAATAAVVARKGYAAAKIDDIAEAARISLTTFYEYFDGKAEAFDAALYAGRSRMLAASLPAYRRARSWPDAVRAVTEASFSFLASEPDFARLICVDVYAAGPEALVRRDLGVEAVQRFIDDGVAEYAPQMKPIAREMTVSAIYAMLCDRVSAGGGATLPQLAPLATYMALAPFLGAEEACAVANRGARRRERARV